MGIGGRYSFVYDSGVEVVADTKLRVKRGGGTQTCQVGVGGGWGSVLENSKVLRLNLWESIDKTIKTYTIQVVS